MDDIRGGGVNMATRGKLRLAVLYGRRPPDLDLMRSENQAFADLFEMPIAGEFMPQIRSVDPDLVVIHLGSAPDPADAAFARGILAALRGGRRKLIVLGDRDLLADIDLNIDLIGHSFYDCRIGDENIRRLIRRSIAFLAALRRKAGRIDSTLHRMTDLSREILVQHADMLALYREDTADDIRQAGSADAVLTGSAVAVIDVSLDVVKSLGEALGDEFMGVDYFQILMFLYRSTLIGRRGVPVGELCGLIEAPYSTTVRRVDELAKKDYVRKAIDPADKRRINVEITSRSSAIVDLFIGRFKASIGSLLEAVGAPQIGR
ncbi:MarR family winged helix-turn-helix transcriptional regulator [Inquilinus sp.]|uniref:MarR family winged helix-turn-helix transcriptional regulator n=1 Tax=Inquilinus sp. TaxID=1932117 RepID=UPI003783052F